MKEKNQCSCDTPPADGSGPECECHCCITKLKKKLSSAAYAVKRIRRFTEASTARLKGESALGMDGDVNTVTSRPCADRPVKAGNALVVPLRERFSSGHHVPNVAASDDRPPVGDEQATAAGRCAAADGLVLWACNGRRSVSTAALGVLPRALAGSARQSYTIARNLARPRAELALDPPLIETYKKYLARVKDRKADKRKRWTSAAGAGAGAVPSLKDSFILSTLNNNKYS
ncbi:hypothetical protein EVAR_49099_1 [Eumeta japonica]|uniref:Uncharacterized protein n=1 Tax=Eumeta variegata TaxID=151549 RepID=A0A4C1ZR10_EUMVA|nr:hypothetical protein EVAR_49099_1 [Eumeta japonica]